MNGSDRVLRKPDPLTVAEEKEVSRLKAMGMNEIAARQRVVEQRFKRRLPIPARGV